MTDDQINRAIAEALGFFGLREYKHLHTDPAAMVALIEAMYKAQWDFYLSWEHEDCLTVEFCKAQGGSYGSDYAEGDIALRVRNAAAKALGVGE